MKQWYEALFENYARKYDGECFVKGTIGECDFIEKETDSDRSQKILDIGCGTGRHSIELTKRGYDVLGIDLSDNMLERARVKAKAADLKIEFQMHDARNLPFENEFDLAIMLCEGGFSLMETDEMNFDILSCATRSLKTKGKLIFTTLNGLFPLYNSVEQFQASASATMDDIATYKDNTFDIMTFRDHNTTTVTNDLGNELVLECNERFYVPSEITWMLRTLGFKQIDIFGAKLGAFSREDKLKTDDFEMLVIAQL